MKIVLTGSLGYNSRPLTQHLVKEGHEITVITRSHDTAKEIESLGARAAVGHITDTEFLARTFEGADAMYCMLMVGFVEGFLGKATEISQGYKQAIMQSGVKRAVHLSSVGAHMAGGNGLLQAHTILENTLRELPEDVSVTHLRPVGFYKNLLGYMDMIKTRGMIATGNGGDDTAIWTSNTDIAMAAAEELTNGFEGRSVRYIASDELTCHETAAILGEAIGMPGLQWVRVPAEQLLNGLTASGMPQKIAEGMVHMQEAIHTGILYEDYMKHRPVLGAVKLKDFAAEFAAAYHQKNH